MAEFEIAGMKFKGGKAAIVLTALSTLGGASWAGFEFYKDYMDMREIVSNIDVGVIEARNAVIETKLDEAIEAFNKALSLRPDYAEVYNYIGIAFQ